MESQYFMEGTKKISISILLCFGLAIVIMPQQSIVHAQHTNETLSELHEDVNSSSNQLQGPSSELELFYDPELGISIEYPNDWRVSTNGLQDYTQLIAFYSPLENLADASPVQVSISRVDYIGNVTQDEYTALTRNATQSLGINGTESNTTLSQQPAHQLITSFSSNSALPGTDILQTWSVNNNTVYTIRYTATADKFDTYLPIVQDMISSFQVDGWLEPIKIDQ
jgi:hypothetical protein